MVSLPVSAKRSRRRHHLGRSEHDQSVRYGRTLEIVGLDHVQIAAPQGCEADARRFFGVLLGLREIHKPQALRGRGGVWFGLGEQQLHVGIEEPFSPALKAHPALRVAPGKLDAIATRLSAAGAKVSWDEALSGNRRFFTEDPWGNRIELLSPE
jgi:catechol 2,3-dioxygenase-like lactoylglutathione lyase family enzyme